VPTVAEKGGDFTDIAACPASSNNGFSCWRPQRSVPHYEPEQFDQARPSDSLLPNVIPSNRPKPSRHSLSCRLILIRPIRIHARPNNFTKSFGRAHQLAGGKRLVAISILTKNPEPPCCASPTIHGISERIVFGFWGDNQLGPHRRSVESSRGRVVIGKLSKTIGSKAVNDLYVLLFRPTASPLLLLTRLRASVSSSINTIPTFFSAIWGRPSVENGPPVWVQLLADFPASGRLHPGKISRDLYTWQGRFLLCKGQAHDPKSAACIHAITRRNRAMANLEL